MSEQETTLRRGLSLPLLTICGLGNILGAGIYVLIGKIVGHAGMFGPLAFLVACLIAALTALSYAEFSSRLPLSAGVAIYLDEAFRLPVLSVAAGLLTVFAGIVSAGALVRGFVGYLQVFAPVPAAVTISVVVVALAALAAWGIMESARTAAALTFIEVAGLLLIIGVTAPSAAVLPARLDELIPPADPGVWQGILAGAFLAFYAFIGFEDLVNAAEEVRNPSRNMPRGILWSLALATILYFAIALLSVVTVAPAKLAASNAPLALIYERATGEGPWLISLISLFAVVNGALFQIMMSGRILYGLSRRGWLPAPLGRVHPRTRTPLLATVLIAALVLAMALWLPIETLAKGNSGLILTVYAMVNFALLWMKRREPPPGVFTVPAWVPVAGLLSSLSFVSVQLLIDLGR